MRSGGLGTGELGLLRSVTLPSEMLEAPEVARAGALATLLHVAGMLYCARHLTDGYVPRAQLERLVDWSGVATHRDDLGGYGTVDPYALARRLCETDLWRRVGEEGYAITGYLLDNASRAEVDVLLKKKRGYHERRRIKLAVASERISAAADPNPLQVAAPHFRDPGATTYRPVPGSHPDELPETELFVLSGLPAPGTEEPALSENPLPRANRSSTAGGEPSADGGREAPLPPAPSPQVADGASIHTSEAGVKPLALATPAQLRAADALREEVTPKKPGPQAKGGERVKAFLDAVMAIDPDLYAAGVTMNPRNAGAIAKCSTPPEVIARAYVDARHKRWGDSWLQANLSIWAVIDRLDAYRPPRANGIANTQDELGGHVARHGTGS